MPNCTPTQHNIKKIYKAKINKTQITQKPIVTVEDFNIPFSVMERTQQDDYLKHRNIY
jgi:hypothetical protein